MSAVHLEHRSRLPDAAGRRAKPARALLRSRSSSPVKRFANRKAGPTHLESVWKWRACRKVGAEKPAFWRLTAPPSATEGDPRRASVAHAVYAGGGAQIADRG